MDQSRADYPTKDLKSFVKIKHCKKFDYHKIIFIIFDLFQAYRPTYNDEYLKKKCLHTERDRFYNIQLYTHHGRLSKERK